MKIHAFLREFFDFLSFLTIFSNFSQQKLVNFGVIFMGLKDKT